MTVEIGGLVYEATIGGHAVDLGAAPEYAVHGTVFETQELVTRTVEKLGRHMAGRITLPVKATGRVTAERIREWFAEEEPNGLEVVYRTAKTLVTGLDCFIEGQIGESSENGDILNLVVRTRRGLRVESII